MLDPVILDSTQLATLKLALMGTPIQGPDGLTAYELAVEEGFIGTIDQWLDSLKGEEVSLATNSTHILWRLGDGAWQNLIALSALSVSLQKTGTHIQWRVGAGAWTNLVLLEDLRGPQGNIGPTPNIQIGSVISTDDAPSANMTGTAANPLLNMQLQRGVKGDKGNTGDKGDKGNTGDKGLDSWTMIPAVYSDGERRVLRIVDWVGGEGVKPTIGQYVGPDDLVANAWEAVNIRGADGPGAADIARRLGIVEPDATDQEAVIAFYALAIQSLIDLGELDDSVLVNDSVVNGVTNIAPSQNAVHDFVTSQVQSLIDAAPGALDTLNELAAALGDDPNFATTVTSALALKQPLDATLTAFAGTTIAADKLPYGSGSDAFSTTDFTSVARTLVAQTTQALMRTTGLGMSANGSSLVSAADYAAMRTLLSLGTAALKNTGTSGDAVPLLNQNLTWSGRQDISGNYLRSRWLGMSAGQNQYHDFLDSAGFVRMSFGFNDAGSVYFNRCNAAGAYVDTPFAIPASGAGRPNIYGSEIKTAADLATQSEAETGTNNTKLMTPLRALQAARVLVEHFNIREKRFAGGAPCNGIDDDQPAIQAAIDYMKPYGIYDPDGITIMLPAGKIRVDSASIDLTDAHGVRLVGQGRGATHLTGSGNRQVIKATNTTASPLHNAEVRDMMIVGPGYTNASAHGIDMGATNGCRFAVNVRSCRDGFRFQNAWQTSLEDIRVSDIGSLRSYRGIVMLDGNVSVAENALLIRDGLIQGVENVGFRGECITGSKVFGLEVLGCGSTGVYLGDSPGNKDLKWFVWDGGLIDTCPDLLVVKKGGSSVAEALHFSPTWLGYASEVSPGAGIGVEFDGITDSSFTTEQIINTTYAAYINNSDRISFTAKTITDYDKELTTSAAVIVEDTLHSNFNIGTTKKKATSGATSAILESGTSDYNKYLGVFDEAVTLVGANSNKVGCIEY